MKRTTLGVLLIGFLILNVIAAIAITIYTRSKPVQTPRIVRPRATPSSTRISYKSEYPGYTLQEIEGTFDLEAYLSSINFWGKDSVLDFPTGKPVTPKSLEIILTPSNQVADNVYVPDGKDKQLMSSYGYTVQGGTVKLLINLDPNAAQHAKLDLDDVVSVAILRATYLMTQHDAREWQQNIKEAHKLVNTWYKGESFVNVVRVPIGWVRQLIRVITPAVFAADCAMWKCADVQSFQHCSNAPSQGCTTSDNCPTTCTPAGCDPFGPYTCVCIQGPCESVSSCSVGAYWEGAISCVAPGCPGGCVVDGSYSCSCSGAPPPPPPTATSTPPPTCPNGTCNAGENCGNCSADCGVCPVVGAIPTPPPAGTCGNGTCGAGEDCGNCSSDCGICSGAPACNPDIWGAYGSCSGSPATKTRYNQCGNPQSTPCTGTINARAVVVNSASATCAQVQGSTTGVAGTTHQFTAGSASQPAAQAQSGASYVTFSGVVGGTYTVSPTVPSTYVLTRACWSRTLNAPTSGEGLTTTLSEPTDSETLTWDLGYRLGVPWTQTGGGDVYAAGILRSSIPSGTSPRSFILDGTGGYPGVAMYGTSYDFDSDPTLTGGTFVSSKNWLVNQTQTGINYYEYFWRKLGGGTTADSFADLGAVTKPASRATPYYIVGDMTTSGDWTIPNGETVIFIVNGNLTLGGKVNLTGSGFAAFIVNGNITVSSSVGGLSTSSTPVIEGIYVTSKTGTFQTGTSAVVGKERFVAQGMFVAGGFLLQRDLDSVNANTTTAAELFLYNPRLLFSMPDSLRDVPITWEEVAP